MREIVERVQAEQGREGRVNKGHSTQRALQDRDQCNPIFTPSLQLDRTPLSSGQLSSIRFGQ